MHLFSFRKLFCDLFLLFFFFVLLFRNGKREVTWEGRPRGRCMVSVYSMIVERAKNCHKFKRFEVKSSIQTSNFGGFRSTVQAKPHKNQVKSR